MNSSAEPLPRRHLNRHTTASFDALSKARDPPTRRREATLDTDATNSTATLGAAQAHARAQAGATVAPVTVPATAAVGLPDGVAPADIVWDEVIEGGGYASRSIPEGSVVRLADADGDACVQLLVLRSANPAERLNVADTVKVQWQAYLGRGAVLLSDMGRAMLTLVEDTSERHDCLCGGSTAAGNAARYGDGSPSGPTPSARDLLVLGAMKLGLGRVDVGPNVNLFKGVRVDEDGSLHLEGEPVPGRIVDLRAEMGLDVVLSNVPHPLDGRAEYTATPVRVTAWRARRPDPDPFRASSPERARAYLNTDELRLAGSA